MFDARVSTYRYEQRSRINYVQETQLWVLVVPHLHIGRQSQVGVAVISIFTSRAVVLVKAPFSAISLAVPLVPCESSIVLYLVRR